MRTNIMTLALVAVGAALTGCQSFGSGDAAKLEAEIAAIGQRLVAVETEINQNTADIAGRVDGVHTQVRYRPLVSWAETFSSGPQSTRTISFRQTSSSGDIDAKSHRCRPFGHSRAGHWVKIHEQDSTRATLFLERFTVAPQPDGLRFVAPLHFNLRTQVEGRYRPPCLPWGPHANVGVTGETHPTATFRLRFAQGAGDTVKYSLELVSPNRIGLELAAHVAGIRIRETINLEGLAKELAGGTIDLMLDKDGELLLPDGRKVGYAVQTVNPRFATDGTGVQLSSDIAIQIDPPATANKP